MKRKFLVSLGGLFFAALASAQVVCPTPVCAGGDCQSACINSGGNWITGGPKSCPKCNCTHGAQLDPTGVCVPKPKHVPG